MFGLDPMTLAIGVGIGIFGGKAAKELLVKFVPATAPFFATFDSVQKQLLNVVNRADDTLNKNPDLKKWADDTLNKGAAKLIK